MLIIEILLKLKSQFSDVAGVITVTKIRQGNATQRLCSSFLHDCVSLIYVSE